MMDGYLDDVYDRTKTQFKKDHPEVVQADKAWNEYINESKQLTNKLLGEYGKKKIKGEELNDVVYFSTNMNDILKMKV